jgi:hypothetical protein
MAMAGEDKVPNGKLPVLDMKQIESCLKKAFKKVAKTQIDLADKSLAMKDVPEKYRRDYIKAYGNDSLSRLKACADNRCLKEKDKLRVTFGVPDAYAPSAEINIEFIEKSIGNSMRWWDPVVKTTYSFGVEPSADEKDVWGDARTPKSYPPFMSFVNETKVFVKNAADIDHPEIVLPDAPIWLQTESRVLALELHAGAMACLPPSSWGGPGQADWPEKQGRNLVPN